LLSGDDIFSRNTQAWLRRREISWAAMALRTWTTSPLSLRSAVNT